MKFSAADRQYMERALRLAAQGLYTTTPNPRVGCVLVKHDVIVGEGWHERAGGPHAEIHALSAAGARAAGATAYVTLEPCAHQGRTPPCADALIAAGVHRVVAAMTDPNPLVAGQGLARLKAAGMVAESGLLESASRELNIGFISRMTRGRPWVRLKLAASLDGKTALANGVSQWITGEQARRDVHHWRACSCAVMTGSGTVLADDPRLTVRGIDTPRLPLRIILDSRLSTPPGAAVLAGGGCLIACAVADPEKSAPLVVQGAEILVLPDGQGRVALAALLHELGRRGCNEILVEAGARLGGALLGGNHVDELLLYQAPCLLGNAARGLCDLGELTRLDQSIRLEVLERRLLGEDVFLRANVRRTSV